MRKLFSSKKAQITIFIIIGIILLFSSALIMYIKNRVTGTSPSPIVIQQNLPDDLEGLKKYVEQCVYQTGKNALVILGSQGGYIYPSEYGVSPNVYEPTEGNGIQPFTELDGYVIPYWHYLRSPNTCQGICYFSSMKPRDFSMMEDQVSRYVEENLNYCIKDFGAYKNMGYTVEEKGPLKVKTTITRSDVVIDMDWPLLAGLDTKKTVNQYLVHLPVNFRDIYLFADKITYLESNYTVFETHTLNTIMAYAADRLPSSGKLSVAEIFSSGGQHKWSLSKSMQIVKESIRDYTRTVSVKNTLNLDYNRLYHPDPIIQAAKFKTVIDTNSSDVYPYSVNFRYSDKWPIYFDITPREGDVVKGDMFSFGVLTLIGMAIKTYDFQYDISYPVVATVNDPNAFYGEGYNFNFAFEANVRNNKPMKVDFYALYVDSGKQGFECDEGQKVSGNITVNATDYVTNLPIPDAVVNVYFGKNGCYIGDTNENGVLVERYPKGIGELVVSKSQDYLSQSVLFWAKQDTKKTYNVTLYPIIEKNVVIKKYIVKKNFTNTSGGACIPRAWEFQNDSVEDLSENETISVMLKRIITPQSSDNLMGSLEFTKENENDTQTLRIGPGNYELKVIAKLDKNITIPAQSKTYGGDDDTVTINFNETSTQPYSEGMLDFSNSTFYFTVDPENLYNSDYIEINALVYDLDSVPLGCRQAEPSDFSPSPNANELLKLRKHFLTPKFKNYDISG